MFQGVNGGYSFSPVEFQKFTEEGYHQGPLSIRQVKIKLQLSKVIMRGSYSLKTWFRLPGLFPKSLIPSHPGSEV